MRFPKQWHFAVVTTGILALAIVPFAQAAPVTTAPTAAQSFPLGPLGDPPDPGGAEPDFGGLEGTPLPPSRDVSAAKKRQAEARQPASPPSMNRGRMAGEPPITGYLTSTAELAPPLAGQRPYESSKVTDPAGYGVLDGTGVRMFTFAGETKQWNHPVGQAQYVMHNLNSYRITQDPIYLDIAAKNAQRLVDRRVVSGGAWYYPYDFDFAVHGDTTQTLRAPWYSGMAQGQALSAFVRLFEYTQDPQWQAAADATYGSLRQPPEGEAPFASWVDEAQRLWLEEYPRYPVDRSEKVLNGHIYALFGLHDYWNLTQSAEVRDLALGALRTVELTVPTEFRRPGGASVYSLWHKYPTFTYHNVHVRQFLELWRMVKSRVFFVNVANTYRSDYPLRGGTGTAVISPRVKALYKADNNGKISATRSVSFTKQTGAPYDYRHRLQGGPIGLRLSAGAYAGWFVPEGFGVAWSKGAIDVHAYLPEVTIQFQPKSFTAYRLDAAGNIAGHRNLTITRDSNAPTPKSAIVQGRPAWYFPSGAFADLWVPMQSGIVPLL